MAECDSNKPRLSALSDELHTIAASLAGVNAVLALVSGESELSLNAANAISLLEGATDRLNAQICAIADKLHEVVAA